MLKRLLQWEQWGHKDKFHTDETFKKIEHQTLLVHGREDAVVPVTNSERLIHLLPNAELHIFGGCGHWTQIEKAEEFSDLVKNFITR